MSTEQQKARFFGMHIGHQVYLPKYEEELALLRGVSLPSQSGTDVFNASCTGTKKRAFIAPLQFCQLILSPLSYITDKDAMECARIVLGSHALPTGDIQRDEDRVTVLCNKKRVFHIFADMFTACTFYAENDKQTISFNDFSVADYLRSGGYCLPYMGKDPYQEGWAVRV